MRLFHADSLLTSATTKQIPEGTIKGLFIRYSGTAQAAVTVTLANLGNIRVNLRGTDIVNVPVSFLNAMNNLFYGAAEFASALGGAFTCSVYVPFHAPWDEQNGIFSQIEDNPHVQLQYPALTAAVIVSGNVEVYAILAEQVARYIPIWNQQNLQVGGAGRVTQRLQNFNISSLFIEANANFDTVFINKDNKSIISSNQATLTAKSNLDNRVETALTTFEINLNPYRRIEQSIASLIEVDINATAATTIVMYFLAFLFDDDMRMRSASYIQKSAPAVATSPIAKSAAQIYDERMQAVGSAARYNER